MFSTVEPGFLSVGTVVVIIIVVVVFFVIRGLGRRWR